MVNFLLIVRNYFQVCCALGLIVGNMGIHSIRTMELADINNYVKSLVTLGALSIFLRILWVADVIMEVQKAVKQSQDGTTGGDGGKDGSGTMDPTITDDAKIAPLDSKTVVTFGIQVNCCGFIRLVFLSLLFVYSEQLFFFAGCNNCNDLFLRLV